MNSSSINIQTAVSKNLYYLVRFCYWSFKNGMYLIGELWFKINPYRFEKLTVCLLLLESSITAANNDKICLHFLARLAWKLNARSKETSYFATKLCQQQALLCVIAILTLKLRVIYNIMSHNERINSKHFLNNYFKKIVRSYLLNLCGNFDKICNLLKTLIY